MNININIIYNITEYNIFDAIEIIMNHVMIDDEGSKQLKDAHNYVSNNVHTSLCAMYIDMTPPPPRSPAEGDPVF